MPVNATRPGDGGFRHIFPAIEPRIEITPLDDSASGFCVECRELRWWMIVPEEGAFRRWAVYDYPERTLTEIGEMATLAKTHVHGAACWEMRHRTYAPDGARTREAYAYGVLHQGATRWLAWWNLSDRMKIYTLRDEGFSADWAPSPVRIVDIGRYRWEDVRRVQINETEQKLEPPLPVDPIGAGLWRLSVGEREHRCLRVIEPSSGTPPWTLCEAFLDESGRTLLFRRYNGPHYPIEGQQTQEALKDSERLFFNGDPCYLWYDSLAADALDADSTR